MRVIHPMTMRELIADPVYRPYLLKAPRLPAGCRAGEPFRVYGLRHDDKWAGKLFSTYADAFVLVKKMLKQSDVYRDVVITCRPAGFAPPAHFHIPPPMDWCGHCRRPSVFRRMGTHPAMKRWPVISDEDVLRCYYCAARQSVWHAQ